MHLIIEILFLWKYHLLKCRKTKHLQWESPIFSLTCFSAPNHSLWVVEAKGASCLSMPCPSQKAKMGKAHLALCQVQHSEALWPPLDMIDFRYGWSPCSSSHKSLLLISPKGAQPWTKVTSKRWMKEVSMRKSLNTRGNPHLLYDVVNTHQSRSQHLLLGQ